MDQNFSGRTSDGSAQPKKRIEVVSEALTKIMKVMLRRSAKGEVVSPRYALSMIAYSSGVTDIFGGVVTIEQAVKMGQPTLQTYDRTFSDLAFQRAYDILSQRIGATNGCPAPMVCHLTDGEYNGNDPRPIFQQLRSLSNDDGPVLVENIYVGENLTKTPINDAKSWGGITDVSQLADPYTQVLYEMSSPLPASYAQEMAKDGYSLQAGAAMLIPADSTDLVQLAFAMSSATKTV